MKANPGILSSDLVPPSISSILTKNFDSLNLPEKENLMKFVATEKEATTSLTTLAEGLKDITDKGADILDESLEKTDLPSQDKEQVKKIYSQTILQTLSDVTANIFDYLKEGKGLLTIPFLAEKVLNVIESFQNFKAKIDHYLPISCDTILKNTVPVLLLVTDAFAPGVSTILKATTILDKATDFLQDKNLNKIKEKLQATLEHGKTTDEKETVLSSVMKAAELSGITEVAPSVLGKVVGEDNYKAFDETIKQISQKPELVGLVQDLSSYAENILPKNQDDIDKIKETIKTSALDSLKDFNLPKGMTKKIEQQLDKDLSKVEKTLSEQIDSKKPLIEKIANIQKATSQMLSSSPKEFANIIKDGLPETLKAKEVSEAFVQNLKTTAKKCLEGNVSEIAAKLQDPKIKNFAKTTLKAGHATLLDIERGAEKATPSRER